MNTLEDRIQRIEDERDIQKVMYSYGAALDYGSEEEWMNCWTNDAVLHWSDLPTCGHEQLCAAFQAHTHAPEVFHKHFVVNARISVTGDTATANSIFARLDSYLDGPRLLAFGRYLDKFVRCKDSCWRFSERVAEVESMGAPPDSVLQAMLSSEEQGK